MKTGMDLYIRFMISLAAGLFGVSMVLKVLLDSLFNEWDAVADAGDLLKNGLRLRHHGHRRAEDVMLEAENAKVIPMSTRMYELKRQELQELSVIESRVNPHGSPVHLTPIMPSEPSEIVPS